MDRYQKLEKNGTVGEGTYGVVYKAKDRQSGDFVALKRIRLEVEDEGIPSTTLREISVLRQLKHPNIVELSDVIQSEGRLYLVFEFVDKDLKKYMDSLGDAQMAPNVIKNFTWQLIKALEFCHVRGVMHRDLKPQNVLVSREGRLKLADFGLARAFVPPIRPFTHEVVTLWYRPPEILLGCKTYALPVDMWAIGAMMYEMVCKRPMFPGDSEVDELFKIFRVVGTPNEDVWPGVTSLQDWNEAFPVWPALNIAKLPMLATADHAAIDMIEGFLPLDPKKRLSAGEALKHEYFADMSAMEL